ncbi:retroviral-like aspartic protease family protein [Aurantiacibacter rhizosphaerae]|uniref:Peptidase A2 domain-containing protein n=1 Tax=Aurantiacibacter rhizosphaerae TaxID=2691582 RepID=A0A844XEU1_9SPHN|nr:retroviral-like aspartic protease family protein [Aurantiacibacter rhizosphaerae]MWV29101.1 hypothetical protein [Aurantiacibacter rhizosphaerae]
MRTIVSPIALAMLCAAALPASLSAQPTNASQQGPAKSPLQTATAAEIADSPIFTDTIGMEIDRYRRMTVPVTIKGQGPFDFMVDTGAQATVLSHALAQQLDLTDRQPATLVGMASSRAVETTMVPEFILGERSLTIRTAPLVEQAHIGGADGILGLDTLQDQRVLLDFADGEMHISDSLGTGGSGSYDIIVRARERLGQLIIHRAKIDGVSVDVIVDTGAQGSIGNFALAERLRRRQQLNDAVMTDVNGVQISGVTRIARKMEVGSARLNNIVITFADAPTFHALDLVDRPALILGMSELRLFKRVAIDFRSRRVLFDLPGDISTDQNWNFGSRATRLRE